MAAKSSSKSPAAKSPGTKSSGDLKSGDSIQRIKDILTLSECPPRLLILSPDRIRRERIVHLIRDRFGGGASTGELSLSFDCDDPPSRFPELLSLELDSRSLFGTRKILILKSVDALSASDTKIIAELIAKSSLESSIVATGEKLPQTSPILKAFRNVGEVVILEDLKGFALKRWVQRELRHAGIDRYPDGYVEALIDASEGNPDAISQRIEYAALYSENSELTSGDVQILLPEYSIHNEFAVLDDIMSGNAGKAHSGVQNLLASGSNIFSLLGLYAKSFGNLLSLKALTETSPASAREKLGLAPYVYQKLLHVVPKYTLQRLIFGYKSFLTADSKLKNRSLGSEEIAAELVESLLPPKKARR